MALSERITALALVAMCLAELFDIYTGVHWAGRLSAGFLLVFAVVGQPHFGLRERFLLAMAMLAGLALFRFGEDPWPVLDRALGSAAFLASFMILLSLLKDAAMTSQSVQTVGTYLTKQPPGRRYVAIHSGGHVMGVLLNFGTLSLLGPLIQRGVRATSSEGDAVAAIRERRQIVALDRGFSWIIAWTPTSVSQAVLPAVVPGIDPLKIIGYGLAVAAVVSVVAWAEDRIRWRNARARLNAQGINPVRHAPVFPTRAFAKFGAACLFLAGLGLLVFDVSGKGLVQGLMISAPVTTFVWIAVQHHLTSPAEGRLGARYHAIVFRSVPDVSPEALTLSAAGFCGIVAAALVPAETLAAALDLARVEPFFVYAGIAAVIPILSNFGLPPMFAVTFLGGALVATPGLDYDPTLLGSSLALGWALNLTASPFGASSLILTRSTGIPGTTLSWRWNGLFSLLAYGVCVAMLFVFSRFAG